MRTHTNIYAMCITGFEGLIKKLMSELPSNLVTYNWPVNCVHWNNSESGVTLNSYVLCGWISGHESEYMETLSEQEVRQSITELVRTFTGSSLHLGNPTITPKRISCSQWFYEPWLLQSPCNRMFSTEPGEHDGTPAYKGIKEPRAIVIPRGQSLNQLHFGAKLGRRADRDRKRICVLCLRPL
ncbi:hypothetical protein Q8A73_001408 [Channa argus]|nr:hypothetical protein Q8A73_001408 [Channa argus]